MSDDNQHNSENNFSHLSPKAKEDYELIIKAKSGDRNAYEILMKKYKVSLYATIFKFIKIKEPAEDIMIETFAKAFLKLDDYNPKFAFSTWLFRIGINKSIDYLRNKKNLNTSSIDDYINEQSDTRFNALLTSSANDPIQDLLKQEKIHFVNMIVEKLSPRYKKVIDMYYYQELSCEEIAQRMNSTTNNIKAELFRARKVLYNIILSFKRDNEV